MKTLIPKVVLDHMAGVEIYPDSYFYRNSAEVQARAIEDAQFLIDINMDGYEDYGKRGKTACKNFLDRTRKKAE